MASCQGKTKSAAACNSLVIRCTQCTNVGCDQALAGDCSNQGFRSGICMKCGAIKMDETQLVMTPQLEQALKILRLPLHQISAIVRRNLRR
jgi:hypothetical protein